MTKQFQVSKEKKETIQKSFYKHSKINYVLYVWILLWILLNVWWAIHAIDKTSFMSPAWQVTGEGEKLVKNTYIVWSIFAFINIVFPILYIVIRIARRRICGKYTSERCNESLIIKDNIIEYGYQNLDHTAYDRVVVSIKDWQVKVDSEKITFKGLIKQKYYEDYQAGITLAPDEYIDGEWILYDYFEPSLIETILNK